MAVKNQRIAYPDDPLMAIAWLSFLRVSIQQPQVIAAYEAERGRPFTFARMRSPIERMIDDATGFTDSELDDFIDWLNEEVWGDDPFAANSGVEV